jgi:tetratricopeptide (TPR) repeat protein
MMKPFFRACLLSITLGGLAIAQAPKPADPAAPTDPAPAEDKPKIDAATPDLQSAVDKAYTDGYGLLQEGKFKEALEKVEFIKSKVTRPFPDVLFMEGACQFNLNAYDKAAAAFEAYVKDFATNANINQVKMGLGRSYLKLNKGDEGIKILKEAAADPVLKGEAGLIIAEHYKKANDADNALAILNSILEGGVRSAEQIQAALMAADLYVSKGDTDKASQLLESVKGGGASASGENVIQLNNIGLKLGDKMLEDKSFRQALGSYQSVRHKSEVVRLQKDRIAKLEAAIKSGKGNKEEFEAKVAADKTMLEELEKRTDYDASLYYRLGRCYFEMQRPYEAILAFDEIVQKFKDFPQRDKAMYGQIMANASLKRIAKAQDLCERFIRDFPDSSEVGAISELFGMLAYQSGDLQKASDNFEKAKGFPKVDKERMLFLRGNVLFELQKFQDSVTEFDILKKDFPKSAYLDDATYRIALASFYQNDSIATKKALNEYIKNFPKGQYIIDARYRLSFIQFQGAKTVAEVSPVMGDLQKLWEESPNDQNIAQVYCLAGDGFNRLSQWDPQNADKYSGQALDAYANAVKKAKTEDVLNYAMENANDLYQSLGKWPELTAMWKTYLETHKESDNALKAIFWISKGLVKEDKKPDAVKLLADYIKPYISNPVKDQVEVLIQQMISLMVPKHRRPPTTIRKPAAADEPKADAPKAEGAAATADAPATPAPAPVIEAGPTIEELEAQIESMLKPEPLTPTANIRILFAKATLARSMKQIDKVNKIYGIIIDVAKPEDLSPMLLSVVGDNARKKGDLEKASGCYERLRSIFPTSEFADGAPVGLGEIYFEKKQYDKALEMFVEATSDKYQGSSRLLDATLGKAKTLLKLNKLADTAKEYDTIARTKEWKVAWAEALFGLGQVNEAQKKYADANAYYRRMYLTQQKNKEWLAKAYLQSARCFVLLNQKEDAKKTLQEMLKRKDITDQPAFKEAQAELGKL